MKCYEHAEADAIGSCTSCGKAICRACAMEIGGRLLCKPCGEKVANQCLAAQAHKKEPALALLLSLVGGMVSGLLIGLGQIYNGQVKKGVILCAINVVLGCCILIVYVLVSILTLGIGAFCCLPVFAAPLLTWLYAMYDAYTTADRINKGEPVKDWLE